MPHSPYRPAIQGLVGSLLMVLCACPGGPPPGFEPGRDLPCVAGPRTVVVEMEGVLAQGDLWFFEHLEGTVPVVRDGADALTQEYVRRGYRVVYASLASDAWTSQSSETRLSLAQELIIEGNLAAGPLVSGAWPAFPVGSAEAPAFWASMLMDENAAGPIAYVYAWDERLIDESIVAGVDPADVFTLDESAGWAGAATIDSGDLQAFGEVHFASVPPICE